MGDWGVVKPKLKLTWPEKSRTAGLLRKQCWQVQNDDTGETEGGNGNDFNPGEKPTWDTTALRTSRGQGNRSKGSWALLAGYTRMAEKEKARGGSYQAD